jgi:hypothetical protein
MCPGAEDAVSGRDLQQGYIFRRIKVIWPCAVDAERTLNVAFRKLDDVEKLIG